MRTQWLRLSKVLLVAGVVAAAAAVSTGAAPKPAPIPLTITFTGEPESCPQDGSPLPEPRIRSDAFAPDEYSNGYYGVSATLDDANAWVNFETNPYPATHPGPRRVMLGFCGVPGDLAGVVAADVYAFLFKNLQTDSTLRSMVLWQTTQRRFYLQWPRTATYRLSWYPAEGSGVEVTCIGVGSPVGTPPSCNAWTVTPTGPAKLQKFSKNGTLLTPLGSYDMPFEMTIKVK